jgi:hypothetical protein
MKKRCAKTNDKGRRRCAMRKKEEWTGEWDLRRRRRI